MAVGLSVPGGGVSLRSLDTCLPGPPGFPAHICLARDPKSPAAEACLSQRDPQPQWRWSQGHSALKWTWEWRKVPREGLGEEMNQIGLVGLSE